jgi:ribosome recycling factor
MIKDLFTDTGRKMEKTIEVLKKELATLRTGRASLSILDGISVDYYGNPTPINQVASCSVPEARLIVLTPWDPAVIKEIEKAIMRSDLGLNPTNDGKVIRISIPVLTEERRQQLTKVVKKHGEEAKVALRSIRHDAINHAKKMMNDKAISEDDNRRAQEEVQKITDRFTHTVDDLVKRKEGELLEV